jgi:hypothetical protein
MGEHKKSVGETSDWYTPKSIFDALGLVFDLDPTSPGPGLCHVPARKIYTQADDGLALPWHGHGVAMRDAYRRTRPLPLAEWQHRPVGEHKTEEGNKC